MDGHLWFEPNAPSSLLQARQCRQPRCWWCKGKDWDRNHTPSSKHLVLVWSVIIDQSPGVAILECGNDRLVTRQGPLAGTFLLSVKRLILLHSTTTQNPPLIIGWPKRESFLLYPKMMTRLLTLMIQASQCTLPTWVSAKSYKPM